MHTHTHTHECALIVTGHEVSTESHKVHILVIVSTEIIFQVSPEHPDGYAGMKTFNLSFRAVTCHVSSNHLESLKNYRGLGPLPRDFDLIGMECNLMYWEFLKLPRYHQSWEQLRISWEFNNHLVPQKSPHLGEENKCTSPRAIFIHTCNSRAVQVRALGWGRGPQQWAFR